MARPYVPDEDGFTGFVLVQNVFEELKARVPNYGAYPHPYSQPTPSSPGQLVHGR